MSTQSAKCKYQNKWSEIRTTNKAESGLHSSTYPPKTLQGPSELVFSPPKWFLPILITGMLDFERKVVSINNKEVKFVVRVMQFVIFYIKRRWQLFITLQYLANLTQPITQIENQTLWLISSMILSMLGGGDSSLRACNSYSKPKSQHFYRQLVYFRPLFSKFRSICEKAMAGTWVSCTLLVMGSWYLKVFLC